MRHIYLLLLATFTFQHALADDLELIRLPEGFGIEVYAEVENARSLTLADDGTVFVGNRSGDSVWAVRDLDRDGAADTVIEIDRDLDMPNGVAFHAGDLYVADNTRILRYPDILQRLEHPPEPEVIYAGLPDKSHHGWRYLAIGPDERLHVSVGVPCNVCIEPGTGVILSMTTEGKDVREEARGVRNSVGLAFSPETGNLWFTDNGRDLMGDDLPSDELNEVTERGQHFGFPYCHEGTLPDPEYGKAAECGDYVAPRFNLGAHVASLGLRFYDGSQFPEHYRGGLFVAEHGSWNRSSKVGYRVVFLSEQGGKLQQEIFAEGWLQGGRSWGRPVDVLVMADGSLLVSDDANSRIYRISWRGRH